MFVYYGYVWLPSMIAVLVRNQINTYRRKNKKSDHASDGAQINTDRIIFIQLIQAIDRKYHEPHIWTSTAQMHWSWIQNKSKLKYEFLH